MAPNSLFSILLRSPWWVSLLVATLLGMLGVALLPDRFRIAGALSGLPFAVIAALAAKRQWGLPSAARVARTHEAVSRMGWTAFSALLEQAFRREGYSVQRAAIAGIDFDLERRGRRMLVCARRWKSAHTGLEALRALQAARDGSDAADALYIGLGPVNDKALPYAAEHRITIWQAAELAQALRGLPLEAVAAR